MPTYEYECSLCHFRFDQKQRFDEEPVSICPQCQGKARRVIHSVPVIYKGSGFHTTDYGSGWPRPALDKGKGEEAKAGAKAEEGI